MDNLQPAAAAAPRRGRPPGTSRRTLELIALRLFTAQGFDETCDTGRTLMSELVKEVWLMPGT